MPAFLGTRQGMPFCTPACLHACKLACHLPTLPHAFTTFLTHMPLVFPSLSHGLLCLLLPTAGLVQTGTAALSVFLKSMAWAGRDF